MVDEMRLCPWLLLAAMAFGPAAVAEDPVPDDAAVEAEGAVIRDVIIRAGNIFDTDADGEDRWLYRLINRLHRVTRTPVLRRQLLFQPGDTFSSHEMEETERLLRESDYLYDAEVRPVGYDGDAVDVEVMTRDVWSLQGGIGFGRSGGKNTTRIGLEDENFLGLGKEVTFMRESGVDRTTSLLGYIDPNLLNRRFQLRLGYSDNSDGKLMRLALERPFYRMDSRWAAGIRMVSDRRIDPQYQLGRLTNEFGHEEEFLEIYGGRSRGLQGGKTRRLTAGITVDRDRFSVSPQFPEPSILPQDRDLVYPWIAVEALHDRFIVARDMDKLHRSEDRNIGRHYRVRLGFASSSFGSDRDQAIVKAEYGSGLASGTRHLLFYDGYLSGRFGSSESENIQAGGAVRYYFRKWSKSRLYGSLGWDMARKLDPENQLLIGGDSGLRGYPLRYQSGDRRALLTLEQRWYTDWHLFKLIRVGAAAFVDAGRAWYADGTGPEQYGWLGDAGVGLRLGSSRTSSGSMVHIDLATPLAGDPSLSSWQISINTKNTF